MGNTLRYHSNPFGNYVVGTPQHSNSLFFQALIESTTDGIALLDKDGLITYQSPASIRIIGLEPQSVVGKSVFDFVADESMQDMAGFIQQVLTNPGVPHHRGFRIKHATGKRIWVEGTMTNLLNDPNINALITNYRDVTERKEMELRLKKSEANLRTIFNNTEHGILLIDTDLRIVSFNPQAQLFALADLKQTLCEGESCLNYFSGKRRAFMEEITAKVLSGTNVNYEVSYPQQNGQLTWYFVRMFSAKNDESDDVLGLTMTLTDITKRKEAEMATQNMNEYLEQKVRERTASLRDLNKQLESFTYSVSHDLKMPAKILSGLVTKLKLRLQGNEEACAIMNELTDCSKQVEDTVNEMLTFSKAAYIDLCRQPVDMQGMVECIVEGLKDNDAYPNTEVNIGYLANADCDIGLIKHVWVNLISNALKYSAKTSAAKVDISWYEDGEHNVYIVRDNGAGFNQIHAQRMFETFIRLHSSDDFEGNGIGLAIVKKVLERHGGGISAKGEVGVGAEFIFWLPK